MSQAINEHTEKERYNHWILNEYYDKLKNSFDYCLYKIKSKKPLDYKEILVNFREVEEIMKNKENAEDIYFAMFYEQLLYSGYCIRVNIIDQLENCIKNNVFDEKLFYMKLCKEDGTPTIAGKNYFVLKYGNYKRNKIERELVNVVENYIRPRQIKDTNNPSISYLYENKIIDIHDLNGLKYGLITHKGQALLKGNKREKNKRLFIYPIQEYFSKPSEMYTHQ